MIDESQNGSIEQNEDELSLRDMLESAQAEVKSRARDEHGKFTAQEKQEAVEAEPSVVKNIDTTVDDAIKPVETIKAPDSWDASAKEKFAQLPPDMQAYLSKREAEIHKGFTRQDEDRHAGKQFKDLVNPYLPMIRADGSDALPYIKDVLQSVYQIKNANPQDRAQMLLGWAQEFGADTGHMATLLSQPQRQIDPQLQQMQRELHELKMQREQEQTQRQNQTMSQAQSEIERFASEPNNRYFEQVKTDMATLLDIGKATTLQEAYEMACWANPQTRALMIQDSSQSKTNQVLDKASKAKAAGVSVAGSPSGNAQPSPIDRSLREELEANYKRLS